MNNRERILNRLRSVNTGSTSGLVSTTDRTAEKSAERPPVVADELIYTNYSADPDKMLARYIERQNNLKGEVIVCDSITQISDSLEDILAHFGRSKSKYYPCELLDEIFQNKRELKSYFDPANNLGTDSPDFATYEAGVSGASYLIARTGSIFLNSISAGGRRLTVLPPVHIVLAKQSQLVPSLDEVLKNIPENDDDWSYATFITGASRTSDIEKKLVLGAHGPKRLVTLILKS